MRETAPCPGTIWIAAGLAAGPMISVGLARFAFALLLPAMRLDLGWSYTAAGAMNAANAVGYLLGAVVAAPLAARFGTRRMFLAGCFVTGVTLVGSGLTGDFSGLLLLRGLAGLFGAFAFIIGATLASEAGHGAPPSRQGFLISIYFAGGGFGIVLSSVIAPLVLSGSAASWRDAWIAFGAAALLASIAATYSVRYRHAPAAHDAIRAGDQPTNTSLLFLSVAYTLFGAGYIAYMTFMVAFLRGEGFHAALLSGFWAVLGLASVVAAFFWGQLFARLRAGLPMLVVLTINAAGALVPLVSASAAGAFLSAILFGGSLMAGPSAVTAYIRKARPPQLWTVEIGRLTMLFGLGQCVGPLLAGYLADSPSGIRLGLWASAALLIAGAAAAALQREPGEAKPSI